MKWFSSLSRALGQGAEEQGGAKSLASLMAAETRLYNEEAIASSAPETTPDLKRDIVGKYWAYVAQVGDMPETRAAFCEEFGRLLAGPAVVAGLIEEAERLGPPLLEPK